MRKDNLFKKNFKKQFLSVNQKIENYFQNSKSFLLKLKKTKIYDNYRVFLALGIIVILTLSYFSIPSFFNKSLIQSKIKYQILKKYNIDLKFTDEINYVLLPKPHFATSRSLILGKDKEIAQIEKLKIYISFKNLYSFDSLNVKDLTFIKTDFNINKDDVYFFTNLLRNEPNENKIIFKDSNIFFKSRNDDLLFINKIKKSELFYDSLNLQNILSSQNEVFNIPYKFKIKNDKFNKIFTSNFNSKKIRLNISNRLDYNEKIKTGELEISLINKSTSLNYEIDKNSLDFTSKDKNFFQGQIDFRPFYLNANFNYDGVSSKNFFDDQSILVDILSSEILNNENLNVSLNFNIKDIVNINELNNLILKIGIQEGIISLANSKIMWKDDLEILLKESSVNYNENGTNIAGRILINIKDKDDFFSSYQVKKSHRKNIKFIEFDFIYNLNQETINFDNVKFDNVSNNDLDKFISDFNSKKNVPLNKIRLKNFIAKLFSIYSG